MRGNRKWTTGLVLTLGMVWASSLHAARDDRKNLGGLAPNDPALSDPNSTAQWLMPDVPGDPDSGLPTGPLLDPGDSVSALAAGCESIGGAVVPVTTSSVYRGNAFRLTRPSDIMEIQFELDFGTVAAPVNTNVEFSIHKNIGTSLSPIWDFVFSTPLIPLTGTGRKFYSSGLITPPQQLPANNTEYVIGVTWGSVNIRYFRDQLTYPRPFSDGQVLGAVGQFIAGGPPLDPATDFFFSPFASGAYSMKLCIAPKPGACCTGGISCIGTLTESQCLAAGGTFSEELLTCAQLLASGLGCPLVTSACCRGESCSILDSFSCDTQGGNWLQGKACDPGGDNPCLPLGACCKSDGTCADLSEENCIAPAIQGVFQGDLTTCAGVGSACQLGACCVNELCNYVSQTTCASSGGLWRGEGTDCLGDQCDPTGACCDGAQCVGGEAVSQVDCTALGGASQGDWTSCATLSTGCDLGACCSNAFGCIGDIDASTCAILPGTFHAGLSCAELNPPCAGVCCFGVSSGSCNSNATPAQCNGLSGKFIGYIEPPTGQGETVCSPNNPCTASGPIGICCMSITGACYRTDNTGCTEIGGTFTQGGSCSPNTCAQPGAPEACCLPNGLCVELTVGKCTAEGGASLGPGNTCALERCAVGACCSTTTGMCANNSTWVSCVNALGTFFSGEVCGPGGITCPAIGACCLSSGTCTPTTLASCGSQNGEYLGDNTACTGGSQCMRGACCLTTGGCVTKVAQQCTDLGGTIDVANGACSLLNNCGACCQNGTCQVRTDMQCSDPPVMGVFEEGALCTASLCTLGRCCLRDGNCLEGQTANECATLNGIFASGTTCTATPCGKTGACCHADESCDVILPISCMTENGVYQGDDSTCVPGNCDIGACCKPTGGCDDNIASQCAALGGEFNSGQVCANFTCPATGACCKSGACQTLTSFGCAGIQGAFEGPGTTCTANLCEVGACCGFDGSCTAQTITPCQAVGHTFLSGANCGQAPCPPGGACCKPDNSCAILTMEVCLAVNGLYGGDNSPCTTNLCLLSACCTAPDACTTLGELACETAGGVYAAGKTCGQNPCAPGACCRFDGSCENSVVADQCVSPDQFNVGGACGAFSCTPQGACCFPQDDFCSYATSAACNGNSGIYFGDGSSCSPDPCNPVMIVSADPPKNAVDARQPHDIASSAPLQGITQVDVTFDNDPSLVMVADFLITQSGGGTPPVLMSVMPTGGNVLRLTLMTPIQPLKWTKIEHVMSGTATCVGFLPGDTDVSGMSAAADALTLISGLNDTLMLPDYAGDIDRSGALTVEDLTQLMNLLNGGDMFTPWLGLSLGAPLCP